MKRNSSFILLTTRGEVDGLDGGILFHHAKLTTFYLHVYTKSGLITEPVIVNGLQVNF